MFSRDNQAITSTKRIMIYKWPYIRITKEHEHCDHICTSPSLEFYQTTLLQRPKIHLNRNVVKVTVEVAQLLIHYLTLTH
jgi:hypothetical protein